MVAPKPVRSYTHIHPFQAAAGGKGGGSSGKDAEEPRVDMLDIRVGKIVSVQQHPNAGEPVWLLWSHQLWVFVTPVCGAGRTSYGCWSHQLEMLARISGSSAQQHLRVLLAYDTVLVWRQKNKHTVLLLPSWHV